MIAGVITFHYLNLIRAADGIDRPVHVTADRVGVESSSRGGSSAVVTFVDERGSTRTDRLPGLGHSASEYREPVLLVYDRNDPGQAMLASDYAYAQQTRPRLSLYVAGPVFVIDLLIIVGFAVRMSVGFRRHVPR